jgi:hypothetical protein
VLSTGRRAARLLESTLIAGAKTAIDLLTSQPRAAIAFDWLGDDRFYVYLLSALTLIGAVGCPAGTAYRPWTWLPPRSFVRNVRINWRRPAHSTLLSESASGTNIVHINRDYYSAAPARRRIFAPYFAHPAFYRAGMHDAVREMRGRARNVRVFFAGTLSNSAYSERFTFPILSRDRIFDHIFARFGPEIHTSLDASSVQPIVIISTSDVRDVLAKHRLSLREYMEAMARADFFICAPGWKVPHSHNLIEAMSVGTIPLTNYHAYMRPPLTPDRNCLAFSTVAELEAAIDRALSMPAREIRRLRRGVISYYERHLEPRKFGETLVARRSAVSELVVNDESGR